MALAAGTRLGAFEIAGLIGAGGMGEVYRARDTKLNRDVALKVLPAAVATDAQRLARFRREAQVLAALNHTNIAHIHGLEETGGSGQGDSTGSRPASGAIALVMELVEGEDLAARIARGAIPWTEARPVALRIVAALEAAHEADRRRGRGRASRLPVPDSRLHRPGQPEVQHLHRAVLARLRTATARTRSIIVIMNWLEELRQRVRASR
jgi:serine/threonine protein kinase